MIVCMYVCVCVLMLQMKWVVSAFRQLHRFAKGFMKSGMGHKDQVRGGGGGGGGVGM